MFKKARYWFRNVFGFSRTETNGAIVMIILMVLMFIIPPLLKQVEFSSLDNIDTDEEILAKMIAEFDQKAVGTEPETLELNTPEFYSFDPNLVPEETLISFGVPKTVANRIVNFRNKGGKFSIKSDLLKIYDFPSNLYSELFPFIDLPENKPLKIKPAQKASVNTPPVIKEKFKTIEVFDINQADTIKLKTLKGIGSVLSSRIIKYRNSLGGFISKDQYLEIYGLDEQVLQQLINTAQIENNFQPQKILINQAEINVLASHPYISRKLAQRIVAYRELHGFFNKESKLNDLKELDEETKVKIYPYLDF